VAPLSCAREAKRKFLQIMRARTKVLTTVAVAVPLVLVGAGTAYATHYQGRALPGSTVAGVPVAGMTRAEVAAAVQRRADQVTITLDTGDVTRTAHLADLGYAVDVQPTVDAVFRANESWSSYASSLVSPRDVEAVLHVDPAKTQKVVADLVSGAGRAGSDARVKLAPNKKSFVVVPAVTGKAFAPASFQDVVGVAGRSLRSATAKVQFVDAKPAVTTAAAEHVADQANALVARTVKVSDGDSKHSASKRTKASWVTIPLADGTLGTPSLDAARVSSWVRTVVKDVERAPTAGVRNVNASGSVVQVVTAAKDGATVTNADAVAEAAVAALEAGEDYSGSFEQRPVPATWTERPVAAGAERLAYHATNGQKWVDVNLRTHTMTAYVGARAVNGPVKMVNGSDKKPTVVGTFKVYLKFQKQTMRGNNADGTRYETPDVPWVSYFHNGFALHGAPWRSTFGYAGTRGSHGCINLPVPTAKWIYDFASVGTPVVTHT
jgi:lipoprotein-anchoring transpeptidase ErfK/SrfK